jgi:hypothetical protein
MLMSDRLYNAMTVSIRIPAANAGFLNKPDGDGTVVHGTACLVQRSCIFLDDLEIQKHQGHEDTTLNRGFGTGTSSTVTTHLTHPSATTAASISTRPGKKDL